MAISITIPRLGWDMEHGVFLGWLKPEGTLIRAGEALFTLESDKSTEDVECLDSGFLRILPNGPKAGDKLAVGTVIAFLVKEGEPAPFESSTGTAAVPEKANMASPTNLAPVTVPPRQAPDGRNRPAISPRARRVASELGVDWTTLHGTGRTGRIRERDVRLQQHQMPAPSPVSTMRRTIAERMLASHHATAPVTLTTTADATNLVSLRNLAKSAALVPSYTDILVKLTAAALQKHPMMNASWVGEQIIVSAAIHIGIAVDLDDGLVVPVVRDVPALGLKQLSATVRDLVERARQRKLKAHEMDGGTFTVTNLGAFGIDAFTPIIHYPQCAILGVGRILRRPAVVGDSIVPREQITLSLTFDHRLVDGAPAARFLQTLCGLIEDPQIATGL